MWHEESHEASWRLTWGLFVTTDVFFTSPFNFTCRCKFSPHQTKLSKMCCSHMWMKMLQLSLFEWSDSSIVSATSSITTTVEHMRFINLPRQKLLNSKLQKLILGYPLRVYATCSALFECYNVRDVMLRKADEYLAAPKPFDKLYVHQRGCLLWQFHKKKLSWGEGEERKWEECI